MRQYSESELSELKKLLAFSDRYQINIQFWPEQTAVYIEKGCVPLKDFGGDFDFAIGASLEYLNRITGQNKKQIQPSGDNQFDEFSDADPGL